MRKSNENSFNHKREETKSVQSHKSFVENRVQKIKNKYSNQVNLKQSLLEYQSCFSTCADDKENQSSFLNCSSIEISKQASQKPAKKESCKPSPNRKKIRIQELEEINNKISKLVQDLKDDDTLNIEQNEIIKPIPTLPFEKLNSFAKCKIVESKRSRGRPGSLEPSNRSSSRCSLRENGKIFQSVRKSCKDFKYLSNSFIEDDQKEQKELIKVLCKQIEYDESFMKYKTRLIRRGKNGNAILENAAKASGLSEYEQNLLLECNFEEIDPLFTERNNGPKEDENTLVFTIIDRFLKSEHHWKIKVMGKFNKSNLDLSDLDMENKGYFLKEDFTRFMSLNSKKMYCNRSISLIFKRLSKKKSKIMQVNDFIKILCQ